MNKNVSKISRLVKTLITAMFIKLMIFKAKNFKWDDFYKSRCSLNSHLLPLDENECLPPMTPMSSKVITLPAIYLIGIQISRRTWIEWLNIKMMHYKCNIGIFKNLIELWLWLNWSKLFEILDPFKKSYKIA